MKKDLILIVFPTLHQAQWYIEDKVLPLMPFLKKIGNAEYESDTYFLKAISAKNESSYKGYNPDMVYLSNEVTCKIYTEFLHMVKGDHYKIMVVE